MMGASHPFLYSDGQKRYHTYAYALWRQFGCRVAKIPLDGGFTCPNRDGSKGYGGCAFCAADGGSGFSRDMTDENGCRLSLAEQFRKASARTHAKWPDAKMIAYLQAFTNTYAPVDRLRTIYEEALSLPQVVGLSIATRADALPLSVLNLLEDFNRRTFLTVELGLQTIHDQTAERMGRGHSYADFLEGYARLTERGIRVCIHLINGLPGEDREMMLASVAETARLRPYAIKFHLLHVVEGTRLAAWYRTNEFSLLSQEEYISIVCDQLASLPPETVIQRLTGDGDRRTLIGPTWSLHKRAVLNAIDKELRHRDSWQGKGWEDLESAVKKQTPIDNARQESD